MVWSDAIAKPVTLITGASSGIGAAFARVFAEHGHELVLVARRQAQLDGVADAIAAGDRRRPHVLSLDLGRGGAAAEIAGELARRDLEPAIVVNNAGFGLFGSAAELDLERQLAMIDLDVRVLTELSLRFIDTMARHRGGLLNVASLASFFPGPRMAVYFACKAYVLSFTEALHRELAPRGVKVSAFCPGPLRTEFFAQAGVAGNRLPRMFMRSAERAARTAYDGFMQDRSWSRQQDRSRRSAVSAAFVVAGDRGRNQRKSAGPASGKSMSDGRRSCLKAFVPRPRRGLS